MPYGITQSNTLGMSIPGSWIWDLSSVKSCEGDSEQHVRRPAEGATYPSLVAHMVMHAGVHRYGQWMCSMPILFIARPVTRPDTMNDMTCNMVGTISS